MRESDCSGFDRGMEIQDTPEGVVVESMAGKQFTERRCWRSDAIVSGLMFFRFLKQIWRLGLMRVNGEDIFMEMVLWSETPRLYTKIAEMSRVCNDQFECVPRGVSGDIDK